ncbi:MAG TPA: Ig-like domain-containing protein [Flavobacteriales bacterium]|nr:Ig-like domain-containing protein [Flavobacteriales bacterium]
MRHSLSLLALLLVVPVAEAQRSGSHSGDDRTIPRLGAGAIDAGLFEENKGQIRTAIGQPAPHIRYRLSDGGTNVFLLDDGIAYQFDKPIWPDGSAELRDNGQRTPEEEERYEALRDRVRYETYRMDMVLVGADPDAVVTADGPSAWHRNYYVYKGSGPQAPVLGVRDFRTVVYHDIYPGIDWSISTKDKGIEYDFIVHPGADPALIRMRFSHHEELHIDANGDLVHGNRLGRFTERAPVSRQDDHVIGTRFRLEKDLLAFDVGAYDKNKELRIDPPRIWGTYFGGSSPDDFAFAMTTLGNDVFVAGQLRSSGLATTGPDSVSGDVDGMIAKFDRYGGLVWATYYGGDGLEDFASCAAYDDVLYASGNTSSQGIEMSFTAEQHNYGGGVRDAILVKFNAATGDVVWDTYYGGTQNDRGRACAVGDDGSVYLAGVTYSTAAIPGADPGFQVHQSTYAGTDNPALGGDGYLVRFNPNTGSRLWGTYFGGEKADQVFGCDVAPDGNVYIAGGTSSTSGIAANGYDGTVDGYDAYMAKFGADGALLWGTYYGGSGGDQANACGVAPDGSPHMVGQTFSLDAITSSGVESSTGGAADVFIVKFDPAGGAGSRSWGRRFGGPFDDDAKGCSFDAEGHLLVTGTTTSGSGIAMVGASQSVMDGSSDAYLVEFDPDATQLEGTYYGGNATDEGRGCGTNVMGDVFLVGYTYSPDSISFGNAHQDELSGSPDWFIAMFSDTVDCAGVPGGNGLPGTSCDDASACTIEDAYTANCTCVGTELVAGSIAGSQQVCVEGTATLTISGNNAPGTWSSTDPGVASVNSSGVVTGVALGTVFIRFTVCPGIFVLHMVSVFAPPDAGTNGALTLCATGGQQSLLAQLGGTPDPGGTWSGPSPVTDNSYDPLTMEPGTYTYTVAATSPCTGDATAQVVVAEDVITTWYSDSDGDNFGDPSDSLMTCTPPQNYVLNNTDCDDDDNTVWQNEVLFVDADGDGYDAGSDTICHGASIPPGFSVASNGTDCSDSDNLITGVGTTCDDDDPGTCNDVINVACVCAGTEVVQFGTISGDNTINEGQSASYTYGPLLANAVFLWTSDPLVTVIAGQGSPHVVINVPLGVWGNVAELCCSVSVPDCGQDTTLCMDVYVSDVVGLQEAFDAGGTWFSVRPNPGEGQFELIPHRAFSGPVRYELRDVAGRSMGPERLITGPGPVMFDLRPSPPGVYFLRMRSEGEVQVLRLVVR